MDQSLDSYPHTFKDFYYNKTFINWPHTNTGTGAFDDS